MRIPGSVPVLVATAAVVGLIGTGCASGVPIDRLPVGSARGTDLSGGITIDDGAATGGTYVVPEDVGPPDGPPRAVEIVPPADPLQSFQRREQECSVHSSLVGRGDPARTPPQVEADRFSGATIVREIDGDTVLIEDGRGTRLVIDHWQQEWANLLAGSGREDEPLPDPYRLACPTPPLVDPNG